MIKTLDKDTRIVYKSYWFGFSARYILQRRGGLFGWTTTEWTYHDTHSTYESMLHYLLWKEEGHEAFYSEREDG